MIAPVLPTIDTVAATTPPVWAAAASVAAGSLVGFSLGLTGGPTLARVFSAAIVLVAAIIIFRTLRGI